MHRRVQETRLGGESSVVSPLFASRCEKLIWTLQMFRWERRGEGVKWRGLGLKEVDYEEGGGFGVGGRRCSWRERRRKKVEAEEKKQRGAGAGRGGGRGGR